LGTSFSCISSRCRAIFMVFGHRCQASVLGPESPSASPSAPCWGSLIRSAPLPIRQSAMRFAKATFVIGLPLFSRSAGSALQRPPGHCGSHSGDTSGGLRADQAGRPRHARLGTQVNGPRRVILSRRPGCDSVGASDSVWSAIMVAITSAPTRPREASKPAVTAQAGTPTSCSKSSSSNDR